MLESLPPPGPPRPLRPSPPPRAPPPDDATHHLGPRPDPPGGHELHPVVRREGARPRVPGGLLAGVVGPARPVIPIGVGQAGVVVGQGRDPGGERRRGLLRVVVRAELGVEGVAQVVHVEREPVGEVEPGVEVPDCARDGTGRATTRRGVRGRAEAAFRDDGPSFP